MSVIEVGVDSDAPAYVTISRVEYKQLKKDAATLEQIIEHLRKLSAYKERPECDSDGIPHYIDSGNMDDAYGIGETDGGINLAKALIDALDNGTALPDLPPPDDDDDDDDDE